MKEDLLRDWRASGRAASALAWCALLLTGFACLAFTAAASIALLWMQRDEGALLSARTGIKAACAALGALACAAALVYATRRLRGLEPAAAYDRRSRWSAPVVLLLAAGAVFPRLDAYPWAAPDEVHHLIVARNLAEHGEYASGAPQVGFNRFDSFDSVGPPVIIPVSAAIRLAGPSLGMPRLVMALYFLVFTALLAGFLRPFAGPAGAAMGAAMMVASFGSIYLGRTLYGEVPALLWFVAGLWAWRRAIGGRRAFAWSLAAGLAFGMAILCKTILVLSAFAFLAAALYDFLTFRRLRWVHLVTPAAGVGAVLGGWWLIQAVFGSENSGTGASLASLYRHYLMFGVHSAPGALRWFLHDPVTSLMLALALVWAIPALLARRYDPAMLVFALVGAFYAFWFTFYTPGQIPRYLWFSYAMLSAFTGMLATEAVRGALARHSSAARRALCALVALLTLIPAGLRLAEQAHVVYTVDETQDEQAVAAYVDALPAGATATTTFRPLTGIVDYLSGRRVEAVERVPAYIKRGDVVFVDERTQPDLVRGRIVARRFGRYAMVAIEE